ncbi:MAG TPA: hypothetical protein ENF16_04615 [Bacteroidetes bacterium]|nr:hypothetical protein [Bacteroidota bacterium]
MTRKLQVHCPIRSQSPDSAAANCEIYNYCPLPILILDASGKAVHINGAFELLLRADANRMLKNPGYSVFDDPNFQSGEIKARIEAAFEGQVVEIVSQDYVLPRQFLQTGKKEAASMPFNISAVPVMRDGSLETVCLFYHLESIAGDIKHLERQHSQLSAYLSSIIDLRHEVNNPLLLIIGNAQLLLSKSADMPIEITQKIEKMLSAAEKIRKILQQHEKANGSLCLNSTLETIEDL